MRVGEVLEAEFIFEGRKSESGADECTVVANLSCRQKVTWNKTMRSAPTMHDAKEAIAAHVYTRQLYTALGVGLSSTKVRRPIFDAISSRRWVVGVSRWQSNQRWGVLSAGRAAHLYNKASFPSFSRTMPPFRHRTIWKQRGDMSSRIWGAGEEEKVRELCGVKECRWRRKKPLPPADYSSFPARLDPFPFLDDHPAPWSGWRGVTLRGG